MNIKSVNEKTARHIVDYLNELVIYDREAMSSLVLNRVPTSGLEVHPSCQCIYDKGELRFGLLGVINGLCGVKSNGHGYIKAFFNEDGTKILRFEYASD